ncbi:MAG: hypothetical protein ACNFW9_03530 [Candidatus Kerfeldbacteria bacterium]
MGSEKRGKLGFCDFLGILAVWGGAAGVTFAVASSDEVGGLLSFLTGIVALIAAGLTTGKIVEK